MTIFSEYITPGMGGWTQAPCVSHTSKIALDASFFVFFRRYDFLHYLPTHTSLSEI